MSLELKLSLTSMYIKSLHSYHVQIYQTCSFMYTRHFRQRSSINPIQKLIITIVLKKWRCFSFHSPTSISNRSAFHYDNYLYNLINSISSFSHQAFDLVTVKSIGKIFNDTIPRVFKTLNTWPFHFICTQKSVLRSSEAVYVYQNIPLP